MPGPRSVTLYRRADCGLCEVAQALLDAYALEMDFTVEPVDIDGDPALVALYGDRIPVAAIGEREIASAPIRPSTLESALRAAFG